MTVKKNLKTREIDSIMYSIYSILDYILYTLDLSIIDILLIIFDISIDNIIPFSHF